MAAHKVVVNMAPVVARKDWRVSKRTGELEVRCPQCKQLRPMETLLHDDGFTTEQWWCRSSNCCFYDFIRLEGWNE